MLKNFRKKLCLPVTSFRFVKVLFNGSVLETCGARNVGKGRKGNFVRSKATFFYDQLNQK